MPRQVLVTASAMVWRCHAGLQTNEPARLRPNPGTVLTSFTVFRNAQGSGVSTQPAPRVSRAPAYAYPIEQAR